MALAEVRGDEPGIKNRQISKTAGIQPFKLDPSYRFVHEDSRGRWVGHQSDGTVASEVDAEINYCMTGQGLFVEKNNINTQVSGFPLPALTALGTDLAVCNQTSAQGAEYVFGGNHARGRCAFVIGTDEFFLKVKLSIADVSGADVQIGFRKVEAFQAAVASYSDYAAIFYDGTASTAAGTTKTHTELNGAGEATTNMSLATADADTLTAYISVNKGGEVRYKFNGAASTAAVYYAFDSGDTVVPFIHYLNTADVAGAIDLQEFTCGLAAGDVR